MKIAPYFREEAWAPTDLLSTGGSGTNQIGDNGDSYSRKTKPTQSNKLHPNPKGICRRHSLSSGKGKSLESLPWSESHNLASFLSLPSSTTESPQEFTPQDSEAHTTTHNKLTQPDSGESCQVPYWLARLISWLIEYLCFLI